MQLQIGGGNIVSLNFLGHVLCHTNVGPVEIYFVTGSVQINSKPNSELDTRSDINKLNRLKRSVQSV